MLNEVQNVALKDAEETTKETTEVVSEESTEQKVDVNELAAQLEQIKKAQAGSDKAYSLAAEKLKALETENDRLKKAGMDAEEKAAFEREQKEKELEDRERVINDATLRLALVEGLGAAEMDTEWVNFIPTKNKDEAIEQIGKLKELIDKEVGKRVNETLLSTKRPMSGETPAGQAITNFANLSMHELENLAKEGKLKL